MGSPQSGRGFGGGAGGDCGGVEPELDSTSRPLFRRLCSYQPSSSRSSHYRVKPDRESPTATLALIGCGKQKRNQACAARELYTGPLFTACRQWAETHADAYWIASAKHLILEPGQITEPYELSLRQLDADTRRWRARQIQLHFRSRWIEYCTFGKNRCGFVVAVTRPRVVLLASRDYLFGFYECRERGQDSYEFETPLAGKGIGEQLAWLRKSHQTDARQLLLFGEEKIS